MKPVIYIVPNHQKGFNAILRVLQTFKDNSNGKLLIQNFFFFFSKLHAQQGAWIHDPEIRNHMLYGLSQPGTPETHLCFIFKESEQTSSNTKQRCHHWEVTEAAEYEFLHTFSLLFLNHQKSHLSNYLFLTRLERAHKFWKTAVWSRHLW